jgi:preprotein translocase subunit Sss1
LNSQERVGVFFKFLDIKKKHLANTERYAELLASTACTHANIVLKEYLYLVDEPWMNYPNHASQADNNSQISLMLSTRIKELTFDEILRICLKLVHAWIRIANNFAEQGLIRADNKLKSDFQKQNSEALIFLEKIENHNMSLQNRTLVAGAKVQCQKLGKITGSTLLFVKKPSGDRKDDIGKNFGLGMIFFGGITFLIGLIPGVPELVSVIGFVAILFSFGVISSHNHK